MVQGSARFKVRGVILVGLLGFGLAHCSGEIGPAPSGSGGSQGSNGEPSAGGGFAGGGGSAAAGNGSSGTGTSGSVGNGSGGSAGECAQGVACTPGSGCATASGGGNGGCSESCTCDATGHLSCTERCPDASGTAECTQGAACSPNTGCGTASTAPDACTTSCACDNGYLQCETTCPPSDAGCVQTVLCIQGDHWDSTLCECVPGCVSQAGGPCGGTVPNPCICAGGLICTSAGVPDVGGTCNPRPVCDPVPCPSGEIFDTVLCECVVPGCTTAADCQGPLPQLCEVCADGGAGCAHWACVAGACQIGFCD